MSYLKIENSIFEVTSTSIHIASGFIVLKVEVDKTPSFELFLENTGIDFRKNQELQTRCPYSSVYWEGSSFLVEQIQLKFYSYDNSTVHIKGEGQIKEDEEEDFCYNIDFECTFQIPSCSSAI